MKLFVSALLLAAASAGFAQNQGAGAAAVTGIQPDGLASPQQMEKLWMQSQAETGAGLLDLGPGAYTGCPVVLTSAHLNWPASYLPVTSAEKVTEPNLALEFGIASTQPVRSVGVIAHLVVKENIYQLAAGSYDLRLTFSGGDRDKASDQEKEFRLPANLHVYKVTRVSVERITFTNGDVWIAGETSRCSLNVTGSMLEAK